MVRIFFFKRAIYYSATFEKLCQHRNFCYQDPKKIVLTFIFGQKSNIKLILNHAK